MSEYGFYGRLKKDFPSQIIVDITEKCNLACIHCQHKDFKKSTGYRGLEMEESINTKMIREVRLNKTEYLRYTSDGEPLLHPKCYKFLKEAVQDSGVPVTLTSNGTRINHEEMKSLMDEGLFLIDISIDAYSRETYEKIRIGGKFDVVKENVKKMLMHKNNTGSKTKIAVSFIEQPFNIHESEIFKSYWESMGVDIVITRRLHSQSGSIKSISDDLLDRHNIRKPCLYPWERIILKSSGFLHFCPSGWVSDDRISDFHTTSIKEAWNSDEYLKLRESHILNNFSEHDLCKNCPDWVQTRWPVEGRSYSDIIKDFK